MSFTENCCDGVKLCAECQARADDVGCSRPGTPVDHFQALTASDIQRRYVDFYKPPRRVVAFQPMVIAGALCVMAACDDGTWWTCPVPGPMDIEPPSWRLTKIPPIQDARPV